MFEAKFETVQVKKQENGKKSSPLVAIIEWMIMYQSKSIRSGQPGYIAVPFIGEDVLWPREGSVERILISHADQATVLGKTFRVQQ